VIPFIVGEPDDQPGRARLRAQGRWARRLARVEHSAEEGLRARRISVARGSRLVIRGVDLDVVQGRIVALLAPSGGGKSTLLRALVRLEELTSGSVTLAGQDVCELAPTELRRRVGLVPQAPAMLPGSVGDNLRYRLAGAAADYAAVARALHAAGLPEEVARRPAAELSGGERGRVAVARAVIRAPQVLLLDEPTAALDDVAADHLGATLRRLRDSGLGLCVATHDERWAGRWADEERRLSP
jgi:ABC-type multidrug transport system ATPase subunit